MANTMTPSVESITAGQAAKFLELLGAGLRKSGLPSELTQLVLERQGDELIREYIALLRKRVEAMSDIIVRRVKVNRSRSPQEALDATGRTLYADRKVVDSMPNGEGDEAEICFFKPKPWEYTSPGWMSEEDLENCFGRRGLVPADPHSVAAVNEADPAFADEKFHGTHWKDAKGNWCYAAFHRWDGGRGVFVRQSVSAWDGRWWFAGVRK